MFAALRHRTALVCAITFVFSKELFFKKTSNSQSSEIVLQKRVKPKLMFAGLCRRTALVRAIAFVFSKELFYKKE